MFLKLTIKKTFFRGRHHLGLFIWHVIQTCMRFPPVLAPLCQNNTFPKEIYDAVKPCPGAIIF